MTLTELRSAVHAPKRTRNDQLLLLLAFENFKPKTVQQLRRLAAEAGIRAAKNWDISSTLSSIKKKTFRTPSGWELSDVGKAHVLPLIGNLKPESTPEPLVALRAHADRLTNKVTREFVEEAIACCEHGLYRAAVVLSWVGAVAILYDHVLTTHLAAFNNLAIQRDAKWRPAKNNDGLAKMKESDFLVIIENLAVIGKSTKQELESCLTLRNGCGHPNSLKVSKHRALAHIEVLVDNVYEKFS